LSDPEQWRYAPTEVNPGDHLTRGLRVSELTTLQCWWTGPEYLQFPEVGWPVNKGSKPVVKEVRRKYSEREESFVATNFNELTEDKNFVWRLDPKRFSSWIRLTRVHSWVRRFISNCLECEEHRLKGDLTLNELSDSEKHIIRGVQKKTYHQEYLALQTEKNLSSLSKILSLYLKIDEDGIMRLSTRL